MRYPLELIPLAWRPKVFWLLLALTLAILGVMNTVGEPLNTAAAPLGIMSFEVAGSVTKAGEMLASWDADARVRAGFIQGLDFLFPLVYSTTFGLACSWAGGVLRSARWPLAALSIPLAWGQWLAALFDAIENIALVILLFGALASPWPEVAMLCACLKFGLLFIGLIYAFYGLAVRLVAGAKATRSATP
jgi:hypothetical protein